MRAHPQPQGVQADESFRVFLGIDGIFLEGGEVGTVEGQVLGGFPAHDAAGALVEFHAGGAAYGFRRAVDGGLQEFPLRREPEAVVDELRVFGDQGIAQLQDFPVHREGLHGPARRMQNGTCGRLVHASALHADEAVFHQIHPAHAVRARQGV